MLLNTNALSKKNKDPIAPKNKECRIIFILFTSCSNKNLSNASCMLIDTSGQHNETVITTVSIMPYSYVVSQYVYIGMKIN